MKELFNEFIMSGEDPVLSGMILVLMGILVFLLTKSIDENKNSKKINSSDKKMSCKN